MRCSEAVQRSTSDDALKAFVSVHPLDPEDAPTIISIRTAARGAKGVRWRAVARAQFDAFMERVPPPGDVRLESDPVGDIPGLWVHPASSRSAEAILHLHGEWSNARAVIYWYFAEVAKLNANVGISEVEKRAVKASDHA